MDFDKLPRVSKRAATPRRLALRSWNYANSLANGKWNTPEKHEVENTRSVMEKIGIDIVLEGQDVEAIYNEMTISFRAMKRYVDTEGGEDYLAPLYSFISTTTQDLGVSELPANVLKEILFDVDEQDHPLYEVFEKLDEESAAEMSGESKNKIMNALDDFNVQRAQEERYQIDENGEVDEYEVRYLYMLDETNVHEVSYSGADRELAWQPVRFDEGEMQERKPLVLSRLTAGDVESDIKSIDASIEQFMTAQEVEALSYLTELPEKERIRRVMSMLSLVSGGFVDLRTPIFRAQQWYNNTYDYLLHRR